VLFFILIKFFYSYRHFLYDRYIFVSPIFFLIIIPVIRIDSLTAFSRSTGAFCSTDLSHPKSFFIALGKRPAGVIFDIGGDSKLLKYSRKLVNPSDRVYIAPLYRFFCQRCARRYIAISDRNFWLYFISDRRIRCIYCANINKKYLIIKFYYSAPLRYRADITFINRFLICRFLRQFVR
jgi:hypothetical protein